MPAYEQGKFMQTAPSYLKCTYKRQVFFIAPNITETKTVKISVSSG